MKIEPSRLRGPGRRAALVALACLAVGACGDAGSPAEPEILGFGPEEPRLGTVLGSRPAAQGWVNPREIVVVRGARGALAGLLASGGSRSFGEPVLGEDAVLRSGSIGVAPLSDPPGLFVSALEEGASGGTLFRFTDRDAEPEIVVDDAAWPSFSVSADGMRLAYLRVPRDTPDGEGVLVVRDMEAGAELVVGSGGSVVCPCIWAAPFSLSPGGEWLVFANESPPAIHLFSFAEGTTADITPDLEVDEGGLTFSRDVLWSVDTPYLFFVRREGGRQFTVVRLNGRTGTEAALTRVPEGEDVFPKWLTLSPDGRRIAAWVAFDVASSCDVLPAPPDGPCEILTHWKLQIWTPDPRGGTWDTAAEVATSGEPQWLSFSPDGRVLGYEIAGNLYAQELAPEE